jgi:hypothetical protein
MIAIRLLPPLRSVQVDQTTSPKPTPVHEVMSSPLISISMQARLNAVPSVRTLIAKQEDAAHDQLTSNMAAFDSATLKPGDQQRDAQAGRSCDSQRWRISPMACGSRSDERHGERCCAVADRRSLSMDIRGIPRGCRQADVEP